MPIITDIFDMLPEQSSLVKAIGLDSSNTEQRFNLVMALKQIEAAALGYTEKPLNKIREIGFDAANDIYGLGYDRLTDMIVSGEALNAGIGLDSQGLYGATELTYFDPRFFEILHKPLRFREHFNVTHLSDPADTQYSYKMERLVGKANFTGEDGTTHYKVDIVEEDTFANIKKIIVEFEITTDDMRSAIKTGRPIEVRKMKAAFRSAEEQMNDAAIIGSDKPKLLGFITHPDIVEDEVADGAGGGDPKHWDNKTPEEILIGDIGSVVATMRETTFDNHSPTHMGLSIERYNYLAQRWIQSVMPISLLKWLMDNIGAYGIEKIVSMPELAGAGPGGENMAVFWDNRDANIEIDVPMELKWLPPQFKGTKIVFIGEAKISDMILRRKQSARRIFGF